MASSVKPNNFDPTPGQLAANQRVGFLNDSYGVAPVIKQYWHVAVRWKWLVVGIIALSVAIGLVVTLLTAPRYTARAQIEISREQKKVTNVQGLDADESAQDLEFYETQYSLLRSRSLAERVVKAMDLDRNDDLFSYHGMRLNAAHFGDLSQGPLSPEQQAERRKLATTLLLKNIDIAPVRRSRLVNIGYTSRSPAFSANVANIWTKQFIAASMDRQLASTADARKFLEDRLGALRGKLEQSERDAVAFATRNNIVNLDTSRDAEGKTQVQRTLAASNLDALNAALNAATADRIAAESRAKSAKDAGNSADALANEAMSQMRQKRAEVAAEYAQMLVRFEPNYPPAKALKGQLDALDVSITHEAERVAASRTLSYRDALARETELKAQVRGLKKTLDQQQQNSIQYNIFQRDADTNRQLYDALLQRYKEIGVAGMVGISNIVVVDTASIPDEPSAPKLITNLSVALLIGLALAVLAAIALEQIDEGVENPSQINQLFQLPMLGHVPLIDTDVIEDMDDPKSYVSEAYFTIRSNLAFTTDHGLPRSFIVTSTRAEEGKSTTSYALARIIARTGKTVLLVDGDMRSPDVHHVTGVENVVGFSNALAGDDDVRGLVRPTRIKGLSVLTSGPRPPSAAELLSSDRVRSIVLELQRDFDHVVIDAPPILGLSDAPLLSRAVEGVVVVIQAEGVAVRGIRAALDRLRMGGASIFGAVLTKLKANQLSSYGYGYGYGYEYGRKNHDHDA